MLKILTSRVALYGYIAILLSGLAYSCRKQIEAKNAFKAQNTALERTLDDKSQELLVTLTDAEMKTHLKDSTIKLLLNQLAVKPKQVISYKRIASDRVVHDTITEIELVEDFNFQTKYSFFEDCFVADVDLSGKHPTIKAHIKNEFIDINYTQRRRLFGKEYLPRLGKKEVYQTLVSSCGDSLRINQKITTQ